MVRHQESPIGSSGETPGITERRSFTSFQMVHTHTHTVRVCASQLVPCSSSNLVLGPQETVLCLLDNWLRVSSSGKVQTSMSCHKMAWRRGSFHISILKKSIELNRSRPGNPSQWMVVSLAGSPSLACASCLGRRSDFSPMTYHAPPASYHRHDHNSVSAFLAQ